MVFALLALIAGSKGISPAHAAHVEGLPVEVPVDCTLTGGPIYGSTHTLNEFKQQWWHSGTVPNLPRVDCAQDPMEIISTKVVRENIGVGNVYHILLRLAVNASATIGRYDVGGLTVPCYGAFKGLLNHRRQLYKGDIDVQQCFHLGDKYFDANTILNSVQDDAVICRVVFLDERGAGGEYSHTWFNDIPICNEQFEIISHVFCRDKWQHPNHVELEVCKSCTMSGGYWDCPQK